MSSPKIERNERQPNQIVLQLEYLLPGTPAPISDEQWKEVVRHSGLPNEARPYIGRAITMFRRSEDARGRSATPFETRALLEEVSKVARELRTGAADLATNPRAHVALALALDAQDSAPDMSGHITQTLSRLIAEMDLLTNWLSTASQRVAKGRRGTREKALVMQFLVTALDGILLQFSGKGIIRSRKSDASRKYIRAVCRIADPKVRHFAIEDAMKRQIASRGRISG